MNVLLLCSIPHLGSNHGDIMKAAFEAYEPQIASLW